MVGALAIALAACPALPAGPADELKPARADGRAVVCVRSGGRRIVLARGTPSQRIGGAAASGRHVAWIETRFRAGRRTVIVTVARVGTRTRLLRRDVVHRDRRRSAPWLDVAITDRGELAWLEPNRHGAPALKRVVVDIPGAPPRRVATGAVDRLTVEDGRTLSWLDGADELAFHDLPRPGAGCRSARATAPSRRTTGSASPRATTTAA